MPLHRSTLSRTSTTRPQSTLGTPPRVFNPIHLGLFLWTVLMKHQIVPARTAQPVGGGLILKGFQRKLAPGPQVRAARRQVCPQTFLGTIEVTAGRAVMLVPAHRDRGGLHLGGGSVLLH